MQRTVLIVEDAGSCAITLEIALLSLPWISVRMAKSAEEALRLLQQGGIDILVTDLHLPRMDGFELISSVRNLTDYANLPIVVISGDSDPGTPERTRKLGADVYFAKPYSPSEVRRSLERLLDATQL